MKAAYSCVFSVVLVFSLCLVETGCTSDQFNNVLTTIQTQLPAAEALAQDIAVFANDPQIGTIAVAVGNIGATDLPIIQSTIAAVKQNASAGNKAKVFAAVNTAIAALTPQTLAANKVTNSQSQQSLLKKIAALQAVISGFEIALAPFFNKTAQAKADFQQVQPYIPRELEEQMAAGYGVTLDALGI